MRTAVILSSRDKSFSRTSFSGLYIQELLVSRFLILDSWSLILTSQNARHSFEMQESSFKDRVETVNVPLTGTVYLIDICHL